MMVSNVGVFTGKCGGVGIVGGWPPVKIFILRKLFLYFEIYFHSRPPTIPTTPTFQRVNLAFWPEFTCFLNSSRVLGVQKKRELISKNAKNHTSCVRER